MTHINSNSNTDTNIPTISSAVPTPASRNSYAKLSTNTHTYRENSHAGGEDHHEEAEQKHEDAEDERTDCPALSAPDLFT